MVAERIGTLDGEFLPESQIRAIIATEAAAVPVIAGRPTDATRDVFRNRGIMSILPRRNEKSWKVRADRDTLKTLRVIMDRDPDVSKAVENFILLVGKGYKATAYRRTDDLSGKKTEDKRAQKRIDQFDREIGKEYGGGIESLIPVWIKTLLWHGAIANELEMAENLRAVLDVHPVSPDAIVFKRDPVSGRLRRGVMTPRSKQSDLRELGLTTDEDGFLELPERQFQYVPYHPHVNEHYGISPLIPVIAAIFFKVELLEDARTAIHVSGHGRLDVTIDHNALYKSMPDNLRRPGQEDKAREWVRGRIAEVSNAFQNINSDESFFHDSTTTAKDIAPKVIPDLEGIMNVIDNQVIAGVKQLPILLGRNEGATTTHATVQWQLFAVQVEAFARIVARIIEWAHEETLAAEGMAAYTVVEFEPIRATDRLADENAKSALIDNWIKMIKEGWADHEEAAMDVLDHPPVAEPEPDPVPPPIPAPTDPGSSGGEAGDNEGADEDGDEGSGVESGADGERGIQQPANLAQRSGASGVPVLRDADVPGDGTGGDDERQHGASGDTGDGGEPAGSPVSSHGDSRNAGDGLGADGTLPDQIGPAGSDPATENETQEDNDRALRRKKAIPVWIETRAAATVEGLDDQADKFVPSVSERFAELAERYDAAKAAADVDGRAWFETEPGRGWLDTFRQMLVDHYKKTFNVRGAAVLEELGIEGVFDLANPDAIAALEAFGLDRVTGMTDTTIDILEGVILEGIERGDHPDTIARSIRDRIADMSKDRAETIARTETAFAYSHAAIESYRRNGVTAKMWLTAEDAKVDPPCPSHEDEGSIPIDQAFGGTDQHPPAHPRCRCALLADPDSRPADADDWKGE